MLIFFTSWHYYFYEKLKIVEKILCKLNCSYGKVSHTLKVRLIDCRVTNSFKPTYWQTYALHTKKNVTKQNCSFQKDLQILFEPFFDKMHSFSFNRDKYY